MPRLWPPFFCSCGVTANNWEWRAGQVLRYAKRRTNMTALGKCYSLGRLVERLQRAPAHLEGVIAELEIEPVITLNGLSYYAAADETRIDETIRHHEAERILGRKIEGPKP
jgi:hypothetical protein